MCVWVCTMYLALEYDMKYFLHLNLLVLYLYKCLPSSLMASSCLNCPRTLPPVAFSKWLFSLSIVLAGFLLPFSHGCLLLTRVFAVTQRTISFDCWILFHQVDELRPVFPRLLRGHLACPQFYTIMSKAAINIHMQVFWVAISFQLSWVNTEEHDWWIIC